MKVLVLMASPRQGSNTDQLTIPFIDQMQKLGYEVEKLKIANLDIKPCIACRKCQEDWTGFNCVFEDDMYYIFDKCMNSDLIILATPIYSWFTPGSLKNVLDRLVYGMCKYYGDKKGPSLWKNKKLGLIITCGYPLDKGADLFVDGMKRYAKHNQLIFIDWYGERHMGYDHEFMDEEKEKRSREFAIKIDRIIK